MGTEPSLLYAGCNLILRRPHNRGKEIILFLHVHKGIDDLIRVFRIGITASVAGICDLATGRGGRLLGHHTFIIVMAQLFLMVCFGAFTTSQAGMKRISVLRAGRRDHLFQELMSRGINIVRFDGITANRTGLQGIALLLSGWSDHVIQILMSLRFFIVRFD